MNSFNDDSSEESFSEGEDASDIEGDIFVRMHENSSSSSSDTDEDDNDSDNDEDNNDDGDVDNSEDDGNDEEEDKDEDEGDDEDEDESDDEGDDEGDDGDSSDTESESEDMISKNGIKWASHPFYSTQTSRRNILREKGGPLPMTKNLTEEEIFLRLLCPKIIETILKYTNQKLEEFCKKNKQKIEPFTETELKAFFGLLLFLGVHHSSREHLTSLWHESHFSMTRATFAFDRFKTLLRFIRFDNSSQRKNRLRTSKTAAIDQVWETFNQNLSKNYKLNSCATVDEQLFPFRGRTPFTQYLPSKPAKYGIKIFWVADAETFYPWKGKIYAGKLAGAERQTNIGPNTVLDLVYDLKKSGRNITADNFFITEELSSKLLKMNLTLVGTVRSNKRFLPLNMKADKNRKVMSTNFAFSQDITLCSYVPKKNKAVILLSTMHNKPITDQNAPFKPEIMQYYNQTKSGVDIMDKMVNEYSVKRKTKRWPLALFYNILDTAALAAFIIFKHHHPNRRSDQRREFLNELSLQLCLPNINQRSQNNIIMGKKSIKFAIESIIGQQNVPQQNPQDQRDDTNRKVHKGTCYSCKLETEKKYRKTRKSCSKCQEPVCDEHSINNVVCLRCS